MFSMMNVSKWIAFTVIIIALMIYFEITFRKQYKGLEDQLETFKRMMRKNK